MCPTFCFNFSWAFGLVGFSLAPGIPWYQRALSSPFVEAQRCAGTCPQAQWWACKIEGLDFLRSGHQCSLNFSMAGQGPNPHFQQLFFMGHFLKTTPKLALFLEVLFQLGDGRDCARSSWDCLNSFWKQAPGSSCFLFPKGERGGVAARAQALKAVGAKASGWLMAWLPDPVPDATLAAPGPKPSLYKGYAQASFTFRNKPGFSQVGLPGMSPCCGS